jgi:hypothetical protein
LESLVNAYDILKGFIKTNKAMIITPEQEQEFQQCVNCHICNKPLLVDRVRDHDHYTGLYRGAGHKHCNAEYGIKASGKIPVIFHNLRGYDSHLLMQEVGRFKDLSVKAIPNNEEKYIAFSLGGYQFIDSYINFY